MKRAFTIGTAWTAASSWLEQGASVAIFIVVVRLIGAEAFGVATMAFAFLLFGETLVRDTLTEGIVERQALEEGRLEATFFAMIVFSLSIMLALWLISDPVAGMYGEPQVARLLTAASPTVFLVGMAGVSTALLRRNMAYRTLAIRSVVGVLVGGCVGILMALNDFGAWSLVGQRLAQAGTNSVLAIIAAGWIPRHWPVRREYALIRGLGPQAVLLRALSLIIAQTPTVSLGVFAGPHAVGIFAFAARLAEIVMFLIIKPVKGVAQSALAEVRRLRSSTAQLFLDLTELSSFVGFTAFVGLALIAGPATAILVGPEWREAGTILPFLCIAGAMTAITAIQESYLLAIDRLGAYVRATLAEAAIGLVIVTLASAWGTAAAAGAVAARALAAMPLRSAAAFAPEAIPARSLLRAVTAPFLAAAGVSATVGLWRIAALGRVPNIVFVAGAIVLGIAAFCLVLFGLMPRAAARLRTFLEG